MNETYHMIWSFLILINWGLYVSVTIHLVSFIQVDKWQRGSEILNQKEIQFLSDVQPFELRNKKMKSQISQ